MKKVFSVAFIFALFVGLLSACGNSKAKCDAYGDNYQTTEVEELIEA